MEFKGLIGQSYQAAALRADAEVSMNVFPEAIPANGGDAGRLVMPRAPGLARRQTLPDKPNRGAYAVNGRAFAVAGRYFVELLSPTTYNVLGVLPWGSSPVDIKGNSTQICIVADGLGYCFTLATNTFAPIVGTNGFPDYAYGLATLDTYFIVLRRGTNQFFVSGLLDGTTWSGLDFGSTQEPDWGVALASAHLYLWVFGNASIVIFQDTGDNSFQLQRVSGAEIEIGCGAAKSIASLDNTLFWLGDDTRGPAMVYRADGFMPTRISHHALEAKIQNYPRRDDAVAYAYQESGHLFYVLHFPSANAGAGATHVYDVATNLWHDRGAWDATRGAFGAHRGRFHIYNFNAHLVFDFETGDVYQMSLNFADDAGAPLRWVRAAPHLSSEEKQIFYGSIQIDLQVGDGLPDGSTPQIMIRWSDDGGRTWSNYRNVSAGALGHYRHRAITRRLGRARSRVFEVSGSDPMPNLCLIAAYLDLQKGTS